MLGSCIGLWHSSLLATFCIIELSLDDKIHAIEAFKVRTPSIVLFPANCHAIFLRVPKSLIFKIVADVNAYPEFVPACLAANVLPPTDPFYFQRNTPKFTSPQCPSEGHNDLRVIFAEMKIGFHGFQESYISRVSPNCLVLLLFLTFFTL